MEKGEGKEIIRGKDRETREDRLAAEREDIRKRKERKKARKKRERGRKRKGEGEVEE